MTSGLTPHEVGTLKDLVAFAQIAARLVDLGRTAYESNEMLPLAAEAILHKIGEAVSRLPDSLLEANPQVRWRRMKGMRNLIAHNSDPVLIRNTLAVELPIDACAIQAILDADRPQPSHSRTRSADIGRDHKNP